MADPLNPQSLKDAVAATLSAAEAAGTIAPQHKFVFLAGPDGVTVGTALRTSNGWNIVVQGGYTFEAGAGANLTISRTW